MKVGDQVKIVNDDIWRQGCGTIVREGHSIPGIKSEFDWYIKTQTAGIIGYNEHDLMIM